MSLPPSEDELPRAAVGQYLRFSEAQERGLVAAALEVPYWVIREGRFFILYVEARSAPRVSAELEAYEKEAAERGAHARVAEPALGKIDSIPLFFAGWVMVVFWGMQNYLPPSWVDAGASLNAAIFKGEWWRALTALTLHGDAGHFLSNLFFGLLFGAFLQPRFGAGPGWLGVVLSGALGNLVNAYAYASERHNTIGASTAVFGALGMMVAWEFVARLRQPSMRGWWQLVVPIGGGLALLALLGGGDDTGGYQRVDYMAHLWGFAMGGLLGCAGAWARVRDRLGVHGRRLCGVLALALLAGAWWFAKAATQA